MTSGGPSFGWTQVAAWRASRHHLDARVPRKRPLEVASEHLDGIGSAEPVRAVRLLPAFDQYVIGSTKHVLELRPGDFRDLVHRKAGWVSPVLEVDGRSEGVWSHDRAGTRVSVTIEPFTKQPRWVRSGAEEEAERLATFLGAELELNWV